MPALERAAFPQTGGNRTRADVRQELADASGGGNKTDVKGKADRAWDAAVREWNTVPWIFNRITEDIVIGSHMADPLQPTVTNTGSGDGFTLTTNAAIDYWIEERVKEGDRIVRRTGAVLASVVKIVGPVGSDTVWRPVIVRGAMQNNDATHWAIYRSGAHGSGLAGVQSASDQSTFPNSGAELVELPISEDTYEDLTKGVNPMQPSGANGKLYLGGEYDLGFPFRNAVKAHLVDEQGHERTSVNYMPWRQFAIFLSRFVTASRPLFYSLRNVHREGRVILHPRPQGKNLVWPILRLTYNTYIAVAGDEPTSVLDVPFEVDEAIFQRAMTIFITRQQGAEKAAPLKPEVLDIRLGLEQQYRDWEDS